MAWTASVGISTYPGLHCSKTSLRTLSKASVHVVLVSGLMVERFAWEHDNGADIWAKVVNVDSVSRV